MALWIVWFSFLTGSYLDWGLVDSVQINPSQGCAVVAHDNAIGIQHGNQFEDKVLSQYLRVTSHDMIKPYMADVLHRPVRVVCQT